MNKIIQVLEDKRLFEEKQIQRLNEMINKKNMFIDKMKKYKHDYDAMNGMRLSHHVPALLQNLKKFLNKMDESIHSEVLIIQQLVKEKEGIQRRMIEIDQKIKAIKLLAQKQERKRLIKAENREQDALESLMNSQA